MANGVEMLSTGELQEWQRALETAERDLTVMQRYRALDPYDRELVARALDHPVQPGRHRAHPCPGDGVTLTPFVEGRQPRAGDPLPAVQAILLPDEDVRRFAELVTALAGHEGGGGLRSSGACPPHGGLAGGDGLSPRSSAGLRFARQVPISGVPACRAALSSPPRSYGGWDYSAPRGRHGCPGRTRTGLAVARSPSSPVIPSASGLSVRGVVPRNAPPDDPLPLVVDAPILGAQCLHAPPAKFSRKHVRELHLAVASFAHSAQRKAVWASWNVRT